MLYLGGTVDVAVHEVLEENRLREIHRATGGNWGGNRVNQNFFNFISELVGKDIFEKFSKECEQEYLELLEEFETKKRNTNPDLVPTVSIRFPSTLKTVFKREKRCDLSNDYLKTLNFGGTIRFISDKLQFDSGKLFNFFDDVVKKIVAHLQNLLDTVPDTLENLLMVGGFSESPILQREIRKAFGRKHKVIIPPEASLCVVKGAVMYGFEPSMVTERVARFTYGLATMVGFKPNHPEERKINIDGKDYCNDLFDIHVCVGTPVKYGEFQSERVYYPVSAKDTIYPVVLFRSTKKDPKFVDEDECESVGYFLAKRPVMNKSVQGEWIKIQLAFGHSDIRARVLAKDGTKQTPEFKF